MRVAIAEIGQETDSFTPLVAEISDFEEYGIYFGQDVMTRMRGVGPIGGFLEVAEGEGDSIAVVPVMRAWGNAGGTISAQARKFLIERLEQGLRSVLPVDGVFLSLHGAAASVEEDDVEGLILQVVRTLVGPQVPVVAAVDHHANITTRMASHANALIGHETQPHDPPATGRKAAKLLLRTLRGEIQPVLAWRKISMITPQDQFLTVAGPMKEWFDLAREMEQRPGVLDVSPYPMQPWLDAAEGGWAVVVHTDGNAEMANALATEMAEKAWALRDRFWISQRVAPGAAVRQGAAAMTGLTLLSDTGDSVYGGAPGDSTCILKALLQENISCLAYLPLVDPQAVQRARAAGVGAELTLAVGGKFETVFSQPVEVTGTVAALSEGFVVDLADRGICDLRRTALLSVGSLRIVLLDHRSFAINHPILYMHLGLEIADARMVVVKTASNFQFFQRWQPRLIRVDSPGATQSDLTAFTWRRIARPIYPLDPIDHWSGP